jgi:hypothetical protein
MRLRRQRAEFRRRHWYYHVRVAGIQRRQLPLDRDEVSGNLDATRRPCSSEMVYARRLVRRTRLPG